MDENKYRKTMIKIVAVASIMAVLIIGFDKISQLLSFVYEIISPFLIGGLIGVILNIPVKFFEKRVFKLKGKFKKLARILSVLVSLILLLILISSIGLVIVPKVADTFKEITEKLPVFLNDATSTIQENIELKGKLGQTISEIQQKSKSWEGLISYATEMIEADGSNKVFPSIFNFAKNIFGSLGSIFLGLIFGIYCIMQKENISSFAQKFLRTFVDKEKVSKIRYITKMIHSNFVDFFFGQCLECFVVATIFTIVTSLFGFKCSLLIGIPMVFLALIPYVGNFITCALGILFTFALESPERAILFGILFAVIQTLDAYFIYPRVVGIKVKMPPILIFSSVIVGNGLFGLIGIFVMIPIATTIYMLMQEKIKDKEIKNQKEIKDISKDEEKEKIIKEITQLIEEANISQKPNKSL